MLDQDKTELADMLMEDDPGIYQDLLDERDEAMQRLEAAQRSAREMHIAADQFARERDELRAEIERLRAELHRVAESRRGQRERAERAEAENERMRAALEWVRDDTELWDAPIVLEALARG
jgi:chromosome segregation ATPase